MEAQSQRGLSKYQLLNKIFEIIIRGVQQDDKCKNNINEQWLIFTLVHCSWSTSAAGSRSFRLSATSFTPKHLVLEHHMLVWILSAAETRSFWGPVLVRKSPFEGAEGFCKRTPPEWISTSCLSQGWVFTQGGSTLKCPIPSARPSFSTLIKSSADSKNIQLKHRRLIKSKRGYNTQTLLEHSSNL